MSSAFEYTDDTALALPSHEFIISSIATTNMWFVYMYHRSQWVVDSRNNQRTLLRCSDHVLSCDARTDEYLLWCDINRNDTLLCPRVQVL